MAETFCDAGMKVVLSDIDPGSAMAFANRVREELGSLELPCGRMTVSAGVAMYAPGMGSADVLVAAADRALYEAKESGRDRAVLATVKRPWRIKASVGRRSIESEGQATVLVVDDDPRVLMPLSRLVERLGYRTRSAQGGREALALFEEAGTAADVLLTDVVMPDMNGLVLVDELTRRGHDIPVIYMSGQIQSPVTWSGIPEDVTGFLQKPIDVQELTTAINTALAPSSTATLEREEVEGNPTGAERAMEDERNETPSKALI